MLKDLAATVHAEVPGALEFEVYRQTNTEDGKEVIVLIETYVHSPMNPISVEG